MELIWALWKMLRYLQTLKNGTLSLKWDWRVEELDKDNWGWKQRKWPKKEQETLSILPMGQLRMVLSMSQVAPLKTQNLICSHHQKTWKNRIKRKGSSPTGSKTHTKQIAAMIRMSPNRISKICINFLTRSIKIKVALSRPTNLKNIWGPILLTEKNFMEVRLCLMTTQSTSGIKVRTHLIQKLMVLQRMKSVKRR